MSKITTISFNAPSSVKNSLHKMADANGITISDLMRMGALQIVAHGIVIKPELEPTPYLERVMREAEEDYAKGRTTHISNPDELAKHLAGLRK